MPSRTRPRHRRPRPATLALAVTLLGPLLVGASTWEPTEVAALGLPEAGPIRAFELTGPDAAMGAAWKQTVISDDGKRLLYRVYRGGWGRGTPCRWSIWASPG